LVLLLLLLLLVISAVSRVCLQVRITMLGLLVLLLLLLLVLLVGRLRGIGKVSIRSRGRGRWGRRTITPCHQALGPIPPF